VPVLSHRKTMYYFPCHPRTHPENGDDHLRRGHLPVGLPFGTHFHPTRLAAVASRWCMTTKSILVDRLQHGEVTGLTVSLSATTAHEWRAKICPLNILVDASTMLSTTLPILILTLRKPPDSGSIITTSSQGHLPRSSIRNHFLRTLQYAAAHPGIHKFEFVVNRG
jgi:hypothetical protein